AITVERAEELQHTYLKNQQKISPFPGVIKLMKTLQKQGFLVGMLSNGPVKHQLQKMDQLGVLDVVPMEHIFVSDGVGIAKPD
ncbi:HAD family hydrolase, partial [Pseudomonas sp. 2995-1]|uniref:HAD family hydrolase n=1 Tax=Pseudomonas sp. 2995-1 TaxID=1712679 RepID=UPI00130406A2